jgi:ATP synthase protein I
VSDRSPDDDRRKVDALDSRLRAEREKAAKPGPSEGAGSGVSHRQTAVAYRVLVDMIAGLLVGGFLGYWLDRWLGSAPWGLAVLLLLGFIAGANNAWRAIRTFQAGEDNRRLP